MTNYKFNIRKLGAYPRKKRKTDRMNCESETELTVSVEIPSKPISVLLNEEKIFNDSTTANSPTTTTFSPIKFGGIVDEEITISLMARKEKSVGGNIVEDDNVDNTEVITEDNTEDNTVDDNKVITVDDNKVITVDDTFHTQDHERLQRKSDEDIFNTPKRERHFEDQNLNIRRSREAHEQIEAIKTPQKSNTFVKSLSMEFEQRLASIHVSPKIVSSTAPRSMSPVRCIAELSPVSKLNLNDNEESASVTGFVIEEPKLISPSKIAEIEKIRQELESKVNTEYY